MRRVLATTAVFVAVCAIGSVAGCERECDDLPPPPKVDVAAGNWWSNPPDGGDQLTVSSDGHVEHLFSTDAGTYRVRYRVVDAGYVPRP